MMFPTKNLLLLGCGREEGGQVIPTFWLGWWNFKTKEIGLGLVDSCIVLFVSNWLTSALSLYVSLERLFSSLLLSFSPFPLLPSLLLFLLFLLYLPVPVSDRIIWSFTDFLILFFVLTFSTWG